MSSKLFFKFSKFDCIFDQTHSLKALFGSFIILDFILRYLKVHPYSCKFKKIRSPYSPQRYNMQPTDHSPLFEIQTKIYASRYVDR